MLLGEIEKVLAQAPLRNMETPDGKHMSVAMRNCGALGWVPDCRGYRYAASGSCIQCCYQGMGVSMVRYTFTVKDSHPLLLAGLPAHL